MGLVTISGTNCFLDNGNHTRLTKSHGENQMFYFMEMPISLQTEGVLLLSHPTEDFNLIWQRADAPLLQDNSRPLQDTPSLSDVFKTEESSIQRVESPHMSPMEGVPIGATGATRESFQLSH